MTSKLLLLEPREKSSLNLSLGMIMKNCSRFLECLSGWNGASLQKRVSLMCKAPHKEQKSLRMEWMDTKYRADMSPGAPLARGGRCLWSYQFSLLNSHTIPSFIHHCLLIKILVFDMVTLSSTRKQ